MTDQAISPLRRRMIEDMTIRKFAPEDLNRLPAEVKNFTPIFGRSPTRASSEDVRRYQLHLSASGVASHPQPDSLDAAVFFRSRSAARPR